MFTITLSAILVLYATPLTTSASLVPTITTDGSDETHESSTGDHPADIPDEISDTSIKQKIDPVEFTVMDQSSTEDDSANTPMITEALKSDKFICGHCGKSFASKNSLIQHTKPKKFECYLCGKYFQANSHLNNHIKTVHTDDQPFQCSVCNKKYKNMCSLNLHIKQRHPDQLSSGMNSKMYPCDVCGKQFVSNHGLNEHVRAHTGERPFTCTQCQKTFARKSKLTAHIMTHSGNRPFRCEQCGDCFTRSANMERHVRNVHTHHEFHHLGVGSDVVMEHSSVREHSADIPDGVSDTLTKQEIDSGEFTVLDKSSAGDHLADIPDEIAETSTKQESDSGEFTFMDQSSSGDHSADFSNPTVTVQHQPPSVDSVNDIFSNVIEERRDMGRSDSVRRNTATVEEESVSPEQNDETATEERNIRLRRPVAIEPEYQMSVLAQSVHDATQLMKQDINK